MRRAARRWPWAGVAWWKTSRTCPVKVGDVDTDMRLICHEGLTESFLLTWGEPVARGAQKIADLGRGGRLCVRGDRSCLAGRGDGIDGVGQALFVWCRDHEGGSDARVTQTSPSGVPVKVQQAASARTLTIRLGSEARASSSIMGASASASASGTSSAERPAQVTRPGSAGQIVARARWWLPWS